MYYFVSSGYAGLSDLCCTASPLVQRFDCIKTCMVRCLAQQGKTVIPRCLLQAIVECCKPEEEVWKIRDLRKSEIFLMRAKRTKYCLAGPEFKSIKAISIQSFFEFSIFIKGVDLIIICLILCCTMCVVHVYPTHENYSNRFSFCTFSQSQLTE